MLLYPVGYGKVIDVFSCIQFFIQHLTNETKFTTGQLTSPNVKIS
jgi:hypothetical protein